MKLKDFIENFSHNNFVRLLYKTNGGHQCVLNSFDEVSMDWEILKGKGPNRHYINNEVLGLVGIGGIKHHNEAINIVIEKIDDQPQIDEVIDNQQQIYHESV